MNWRRFDAAEGERNGFWFRFRFTKFYFFFRKNIFLGIRERIGGFCVPQLRFYEKKELHFPAELKQGGFFTTKSTDEEIYRVYYLYKPLFKTVTIL